MASQDAAQRSQNNTLEVTEEILKGKAIATDYSGAHEKVDPREIALVRKLDIWIMPILWLMYWLNYLVHSPDTWHRWRLVLTLRNIGPQRYRSRPPQHARRRLELELNTVPDLCLDSVCRLCYRRYSSQYGGHACPSELVDVLLHGRVGHH